MIWIIASIPFWLAGLLSLVFAWACFDRLSDRKELSDNQVIAGTGYLFGLLFTAGVLFLLAAKICS